ncbi:serine/threonine-protein kinase [Leptolyngbya sp. DQ-M1]|uniref:serine/threonine-protein kinase n=1 Tax=Leptolyngbya sp. DQ-M1 TaxID=2933920 RepID=UPI003299E0BD
MSVLQRFQSNSSNHPLGGRYQVIQELSAGGFGQTFLAADLHLPGQPHCVVKQLKPQSTHPQSLQVAARLFDTEAQVLYRLGHHDQIPRLLAHFQENSEFYLVQEWIDGHPVGEELIAGQPWSEAQVLWMLRSLLDGLSFVHQQNVIHRDIKPSNLMHRRSDGKIVLIDFGAVKQVSTGFSHTAPTHTIPIGTPGYMAIEQMAGMPRFSSDIYAVGVIAIEALTGLPPSHLTQNPNTGELQWRDHLPDLSPAIAAVLEKMICADFRDRYATAVQALTAIQAISADLGAAPIPLPSHPPIASNSTGTASVPVPTAALAVNPPRNLDNAAMQARKIFPFLASFRPTVLAATSLMRVSTLKQSVTVRWREPLAKISRRRMLPPAIGLTILGATFFGWNATRPPQRNLSISTPAPSPNPATQAAKLLDEAKQQRTAKQYQQAVNTYDRMITIDAKSAEAHWGRCYSLNYLQRSKDAITACEAALALRPNYPEALWSKGYALEQQQQYEQALPLYQRAITLKPDFAEAWSNQGTLLFRFGRFPEAIAALDKATTLKPDLAEAWNNRGAVLWRLGRIDESIASIDKAIQLRPDYQDALSLRQQIEQKLNRGGHQKRN